MTTREVTVDAPPPPMLPIDDSVVVPKAVRDAAKRAEMFYGQPAPAQAAEPAPVVVEPAPAPEPAPAQAAEPAPAQATEPAPAQATEPAPTEPEPSDESWKHRYLSMQGRFQQAKRNEGAMAEQLDALARENAELQRMLHQPPQMPQEQVQQPQLLTDEDIKNYGPELADFVKRAAQEAVIPHLSQLDQRTSQMQRAVSESGQILLESKLDSAIPNWRQINNSPRFHKWLSLRNVYTNQVRGQMLMAAHAAADAPRVLAIFRDFLNEEAATGHSAPTPPAPQPPQAPTRKAAIPLETLAAPGRAKPAPGTTNPAPAEKPIITRQQIADFYRRVRTGYYNGRMAEKEADEQAISLAINEGRTR